MAANPIYVEVEEEIPEVVERLRKARGDDTMIVLPSRSRVGQSRFNFQLLKDYASRMGKKVTVVCDDPLVQKMAAETGFPVFGTVGPKGDGIPPPAPDPEPERKWWQPKSKRLEPHVGVVAPTRLITRTATEMRPGRFLLYMSALALLLVALGALAVFVPSASVTLIAKATPFSQQNVEINAEPGKAPIRIRVLSVTRTDSQGFKTTGVKNVPLAPATGQIVFTNNCQKPHNDSPGLISYRGTRFDNSNGIEFAQTSSDITVPWGQTSAPVNVVATTPGSAGNVGDHTINSWSPSDPNPYSCFTVTNPQATGNGTDPSTTPFMQESDFNAGLNQLEQELHQEIAQQLQAGVKQGEKLSDTIVYGSPQFNTDHKPGDNVPSFSGTMTIVGEGDFYFDSDVVTAFTQYLQQRVPNNQQLLTDSGVKVDYRILNATSGGHLTFIGNATAYIAPKLDENAILASIVGRPLQGAKFYLQTLPVNSSTIEEKPIPLPLMPFLSRRITIQYIVEPGTISTNPTATPSPSPS